MQRYFLLCLAFFISMIFSIPNAMSQAYWQQDVHYKIAVTLNPDDHTLTGTETLIYKNNSPDTLSFVWFHLYPNAYKDDRSIFARESRRSGSSRFALAPEEERGYIRIDSVRAQQKNLTWSYKPGDESEMKVVLPTTLKPGESVTFNIKFFNKIPHIFSRFGHIGNHYECTQWYPKIVAYDRKGWHPDGYHLIGEFYGDFGVFDVNITVPQNMTVAATGDLLEPKSEIARLDSLAQLGAKLDTLREAKNNKALKKILHPFTKSTLSTNQKTLHFHAEKVHDFAWVADHRFILKRGKFGNVTINVLVLPDHEHQGKEAIKYTYDTLEHYGKCYTPYPYNQVSVVDGDISAGAGMEYPNLTIINFGGEDWIRELEMVIMHEVGHNWFYGMLGNNEMAEAWLDEGMNSFAEVRYLEQKYGQEGNMTNWPELLSFMPRLDDRYLHSFMYYLFAVNHAERPILSPAYQFNDNYVLVYAKGAWMMDMLRNMLGKDKFDELMQTYFARFQFKHPTTEDFIAVAEEVSGRELNWFFDQWLNTTKQCDLAIKKIDKHKTNTGNKQLFVTVEQKGKIIMPADLLVENKDGSRIMRRWYGTGRDTTFQFSVKSWHKAVWIDPEDKVLEVNNWNNRSPRQIGFRPFFDLPSFDRYHIYYGPTIWYDDDVDGLRTGFFANGGQYRDVSGLKGFYQWSLKGAYAFRSEKFSYSFSFKHPLSWLGTNNRFELKGKDFEGQKNGQIGLNWRWSPSVNRATQWRFQIHYFYQDVYQTGYVNEIDWTTGITSGAGANLSFSSGHYRFPFSFSLAAQKASNDLKSDFDFTRFSLELKQQQKWTRKLVTNIRFFGGYLKSQDDPGRQNQFFLSGGLAPTGPFAFVVDSRGKYSPQNYYFVEGDGNMRGYYRQHFAGKVIGAVNFQMKIPALPISIFYDIGNVWNKYAAASLSDLNQDAGLELDLKILKFHFPFWVSDPLPGQKKFAYRWLISLRTSTGIRIGF